MIILLHRYRTLLTWLVKYFLLVLLLFALFLGIHSLFLVMRPGLGGGMMVPWLHISLPGLVLFLLAALGAGYLLMMHFNMMALLHQSLQTLNAVAVGNYRQPASEVGPFVPGEIADLYRACNRVVSGQMELALLLQKASLAIHSSLDLPTILDHTGNQLKQALGDVGVLIWPSQPGAFPPLQEKRCSSCPVVTDRSLPWFVLGQFFSRREGPKHEVLTGSLSEHSPELQTLRESFCRGITAFAAFPLVYREESMGWLLIARCGPVERWREADVEFLRDIATQLAMAVYQGLQYQQIRDLNARLAEVDRFKTDLIDAFSHDLRSPLTNIQGSAATLLRPDARWDEETEKRLLKNIYRQSKRLAGLVDDLLTVPTLETPEQLTLDLESLDIAEVTSGLLALYPCPITMNISPELPPVRADRRRLEQVIMNLLDNACKYSIPGSPITVSIRLAGAAGGVAFAVVNASEPIRSEEMTRLFKKFRRLGGSRHPNKGSGLGLYITKGLLHAMGGQIAAEWHGGFFRIEFILPVAEESTPDQGAGPVYQKIRVWPAAGAEA